MRLDHVDELVADAHDRVERVHGALEDHRDVAPADAAQLLPAQADEILALEEDAARPATCAGGRRIWRIAFATVLLPQPDSPARPTISPGWIERRRRRRRARGARPSRNRPTSSRSSTSALRCATARRHVRARLLARSRAAARACARRRSARAAQTRVQTSSMPSMMKTRATTVSAIATPGRRSATTRPGARSS